MDSAAQGCWPLHISPGFINMIGFTMAASVQNTGPQSNAGRGQSLWLVSLLKNTANFSSDPQRSCPYVLSARDIADAWAYACHWHINRIIMTGSNWSSFTVDPWWWDVCLIEDTGGRENMQTSASKERRGWEDPLVAQHHELTVNLIYMRSIHVWLERFREHRLLHELSWISHGSSYQQCCP